MEKLKIKQYIIIVILLSSIGILYYLIAKEQHTLPPIMSVSIKEVNIVEKDVSIIWSVKNKSEDKITFDKNQVAQIEWNGKQVLYPIESISIAPDEERIFILELTGIKIDQINTVKITASSNEGTCGTIKKTVYMT